MAERRSGGRPGRPKPKPRSKRAARPPEERSLAQEGPGAAAPPLPKPGGPEIEHRAGFVALIGPPNAGKSTLLNRILGEKLAIVTAKPQTTRSRILGIHKRPHSQLLFLDTPGLHDSEKPLGAALNDSVEEAALDSDLALLLVDGTRGWAPEHDRIQAMLEKAGTPFFVVQTKTDLPAARGAAWPPAEAHCQEFARTASPSGEGIEPLLQAIERALPESPPLYPDDVVTDRPVRWLAGELVREAMFETLGQELPYQMAVEVVKFDESRDDLIAIRANLLVQRDSQKRIVIGKGGAQIREIGIRARKQIEVLVGTRVHLDLWVKIDPKWLKNRERIEELGYR